MAIPISGAAAAYASAATRGLSAPSRSGPTEGPSFGDMLESAVGQSIQTMHKGEEMTAKGVLGKAPKPIQDLRVDMPVIGPRTIELAHAAGLAGVAGVAGRLILIDREAVIETADRLGLFVWGETR